MPWKIDIKARTAELENGVVFKFALPARPKNFVYPVDGRNSSNLCGLLDSDYELDIPPHLAQRLAFDHVAVGQMALAAARAFVAELKRQTERAERTAHFH